MIASGRRRWWALAALSLAAMAIGLDVTILSVALPTLAGDLDASTAQLQWFVAAYTLMLAATLLPGGLLGDRYGRRKLLLIALGIFGLGSVACAYAPSADAFILARVVAGVAAALVIPASVSVLTLLFDQAELPKAIGIWSAATFLALPVGPILGGWLLGSYWWGWVFLINVPVVILGMIAVAVLLPESRGARRPSLDPVGIATSSAGLATVTYGFIRAGRDGWSDAGALVAMVAGALILIGFGLWERHLTRTPDGEPLVDLALFGSPSFTWGTILQGLAIFTMVGVLFTAPQYFQAVLGTDSLGSGLRLLPLMGGIVLGAGGADRVVRRIGTRITVTCGLAILVIGLAVGSGTSLGTGDGFVAAWTAVCGAGMGLTLATAAATALGELSADRASVGSAVMQAVQKTGLPLGSAILGSVLSAGYQARLHLPALPGPVADATRDSVFAGVKAADSAGSPDLLVEVRTAFVHGMDLMLLTCAGIAAVGIVLALVFLPRRASRANRAAGVGARNPSTQNRQHETAA